MPPDRDHELRLAALDKARILSNAFNDIVPLQVLRYAEFEQAAA